MDKRHRESLIPGFITTGGAFLVVLLIVLSSVSCSRDDYSGKSNTITIGVPPLAQNALIYIASHRKFFARNGLSVIIKDYDTGVATINAMLKGEVDVAGAAEFPVARALLQKERINIIACNDKFENIYLVGLKDHGIETIQDLKGKKIGVALQTIAEFRLGRFLTLHGMDIKDAVLVDVKPAQFAEALSRGELDAIVAWQPYVHQILKEQAERTVAWPAQSSQAAYGVLVCRDGWLKEHGDPLRRFLRSLAEAEEYLLLHQSEAKAIVKGWLNYDDEHIASIWPEHHFILSLDQTLVVAMKDQVRWMMNNNLTSEKQIPDFVDFIYTDGLKAIKPEAVNIIR